ncbi:MAG: DUF2180 family protein [Paludibaculum sp.]
MLCYECHQSGNRRDAVTLCHHCSAGLCQQHAIVLVDPVTVQYPVCQTVILPLQARLFLCSTCRTALEQPAAGVLRTPGLHHTSTASVHRNQRPI